jgi:uncharacterized protein YndB with AHSA1/START domain
MTMKKTDFDPGPHHEVLARSANDRWTLVYRQHFGHQPEAVWSALTDPDELRAWAPYTADRNLGSTGPAVLIMIDGDQVTRMPTTLTADAPRLLEFEWGGELLRWELLSVGDGTDLELQHTVGDHSDLSKMAAGWHLCLLVADDHLGGGSHPPIVGAAAQDYGWERLEEEYAERLRREDT